MKIETKKLITFLKMVRMGEINSCLLRFEEDGLCIKTASAAQTHNSYGFLKSSAFIEYSAIGNIGTDRLGHINQNIFKKFKKELDFSVEGNLFTVIAKDKSVNFELTDERFAPKVKDMPDIDYVTTFSIPAIDMFEFIDEIKSNKNTRIIFNTVDDGVILSTVGEDKWKRNIKSDNTKAGVSCSFASPFIDALSGILNKSVTGDLTFHVKTDFPVQIDYVTEDSEVHLLIAPWDEKGNNK